MNDKLTELAALEAKATPGPWIAESHECLKIRAPQGHALCTMCWLTDKGRVDNEEGHANAYLIVTMRNMLPKMLQYIEQLEATINSWEIRFTGGTDDVKQQRSRAEKAEAERDALAKRMADEFNERFAGAYDECYPDYYLKWADKEAAKREGGGE